MKSRSIAPMRVAKVGYIVLSVAMGSLGAVFIVRPETSAVALGRLCGGLMILLGVIKLVGFFSKDLYRLAFQYDSIYGVLLIGIGLIFLVRPVLKYNNHGIYPPKNLFRIRLQLCNKKAAPV